MCNECVRCSRVITVTYAAYYTITPRGGCAQSKSLTWIHACGNNMWLSIVKCRADLQACCGPTIPHLISKNQLELQYLQKLVLERWQSADSRVDSVAWASIELNGARDVIIMTCATTSSALHPSKEVAFVCRCWSQCQGGKVLATSDLPLWQLASHTFSLRVQRKNRETWY